MPDSSSTSFIPKRNPAQNEKRAGRRKVYIGTFIVRTLFFAALVGTVSVYAYEQKLKSTLDREVFSLNNSISKFDEAKMDKVLTFDARLAQVNFRLEHTASIVKLLNAIENSTVGSVKINQFNLERNNDTDFAITASIVTDSFDAALFQRRVLENDDFLAVKEISDLALTTTPPAGPLFSEIEGAGTEELEIGFKATISISLDKVPHTAAGTIETLPAVEIAPASADASGNMIDEVLSSEPEDVNQEIL